ncbi:hypothetical protein [Polycladidibacter hongkongensis]|uniref:hypothetical protein n=1 Tax=Polycladidibacter hongkongensis TaxID=1647556 RepID=UPI00082C46C0|nr:hypothetical protein [Pseudovibrio hongkongensis]
MINVEYEGVTYRFPADATDAEIAEALGTVKPREPVKTDGSLVDAIIPPETREVIGGAAGIAGGYARAGAAGFTDGFSNLVGLPVDLVNSALGAVGLPVSDKPFLGGDFVKEALYAPSELASLASGRTDKYGDFTAQATDPNRYSTGQRVFGRVADEFGGAALPVAGAWAGASKLGREGAKQLAVHGGNFVQRMAGEAAETIASNPAKALAAEIGTSAAAGTGAGVAKEITDNPVGELLGAILGVAGAGALTGLGRSVKNTVSAVTGSKSYSDDLVEGAVADQLLRSADTTAELATSNPDAVDARSLMRALRAPAAAENAVSGFKATAADRTGDPGLASLEYERQSGPNSARFTSARDANAEAVDDALMGTRPDTEASAFSDALREGVVNEIDTAMRHAEELDSKAVQAESTITPRMTDEQRGGVLRHKLQANLEEAREAERGAWAEVAGAQMPSAHLRDSLRGVVSRLSGAEVMQFAPNNVLALVDRLAAGSDYLPLKEVTGARSALSSLKREAQMAGDANRMRVLDQFIGAVDAHIDAAAPPEASEALARARAVSFDLNERFTRSSKPVGKALKEQTGGYARPDSSVPSLFVQPEKGNASYAVTAMEEVSDDEGAVDALKDALFGRVTREGRDLGNASRVSANAASYKTALETVPDVQSAVSDAVASRGAADIAKEGASNVAKRLTQRGQSATADYLSYGPGQGARAMKEALGSKDPKAAVEELMARAGSAPEAVDGAKRAFWDAMEGASRAVGEGGRTMGGMSAWVPRKLQRFLTDNSEAAQAIYAENPKHLADIKEISSALQDVDVRNRARAPQSSGTAQSLRTEADRVVNFATAQSRYTAVQRGQMSPVYFITSMAGTIARNATNRSRVAAFHRILDEALLDPEKARSLLMRYNPADRAALARGLRSTWGNRTDELLDIVSDGEGRETKPEPLELTVRPEDAERAKR